MAASKKRGLSKNIREAISLLADEARSMEVGSVSKKRTKPVKPKRSAETLSLSPDLPESIYQRNLYEFLMSSKHLQMRRNLIEFTARLGFPLDFNKKDNRQRVARRIVSFAIEDADFREAIYKAFTNNSSSSQTEGWLKLIRGEK